MYVCVDQEGQSRTRLNVLHADAVLRRRPSDDQLAKIEYYYYSQSASIITLSNLTLAILKVLFSTLPTCLGQDMYGVLTYVDMLMCRTLTQLALETLRRL